MPPTLRALELKVPPLLLTAAFLALIVGVSRWAPAATLPLPGHRGLAVACVVAGMALLLGAALQFRLQHTTLDPRTPERASQFVARGLYRHSRNPMYLGMALVLLGVALWSAHAAALGLVAAFVVYLTELQIKPEERALVAKFGDAYRAYCVRVRRWV